MEEKQIRLPQNPTTIVNAGTLIVAVQELQSIIKLLLDQIRVSKKGI
jgi:hypothetical protein